MRCHFEKNISTVYPRINVHALIFEDALSFRNFEDEMTLIKRF